MNIFLNRKFFNHEFFIVSFLNCKFLTDSIWRRPIFAAIIQTSGIKPTVQPSKKYITFGENHAFFPNMTSFEKFMRFSPDIPSFEKFTRFSHIGRNSCIFHTFTEFRAFFKTSVFLKNSPFKVRQEFPRKIPCYFQKFPIQKTIDVTNSVFFPQKFRVLQNSPVFIFLNL